MLSKIGVICLLALNLPAGEEAGLASLAKRTKGHDWPQVLGQNQDNKSAETGINKAWKEQGKVRYIGITTSHGRDHEALAQILRTETLDFVQFSYNIEDRTAEERLLPLAADHGIAVLINRPFQRGSLFHKTRGHQLPAWSAEIDCHSWAQFFLKFIIAHPIVTCVIPATSKVKHMTDNMAAGVGRLPDADMRRRMVAHVSAL